MSPPCEIQITTDWSPADALALIDEHSGCVSAAMVRLGTIRAMELARLARIIRGLRAAHRFGHKRLDELHRETRISIGNETQRRILLLQDVARAHGLLPVRLDSRAGDE